MKFCDLHRKDILSKFPPPQGLGRVGVKWPKHFLLHNTGGLKQIIFFAYLDVSFNS